MKRTIALLTMTFFLFGCGELNPPPQPTLTPILFPSQTYTALPPTLQPASFTPSITPTETFTATPTITSTPEFIFQGPGDVTVPILLYHHIGISPKGSEYYISPEAFANQMELLHKRGYKTISVEQLVNAIRNGAQLPAKPIILTFDDGGETVYTTAFPIMAEYGFTGTIYIIHNYIGAGLFMDKEQIQVLHAAGWEVGSHSVSHINLAIRTGKQEEEIVASRSRLEAYLNLPILSFAYPFGAYDADALYMVKFAGYRAAVGLGDSSVQGPENIYYLYRQSITPLITLDEFAKLLPWE